MFEGFRFEYVIQQNTVVIKRKAVPVTGVQMQTITGKVVGQDSVPLPGVTILLKGTSSGVVTDLNGKYTINIPVTGDPVLLFTFIG